MTANKLRMLQKETMVFRKMLQDLGFVLETQFRISPDEGSICLGIVFGAIPNYKFVNEGELRNSLALILQRQITVDHTYKKTFWGRWYLVMFINIRNG